MADQPITRTDVVKVIASSLKTDNYGHLHFQDDKGNEYLLSKKRSGMFSIISTAGDQSVKLSFADYNGTEYLALVSLASVSQPPPRQVVAQNGGGVAPKPMSSATKSPNVPNSPISGPEKGMALKEIGDNFRVGLFQPDEQPELWKFYKGELSRVVGVKIN